MSPALRSGPPSSRGPASQGRRGAPHLPWVWIWVSPCSVFLISHLSAHRQVTGLQPGLPLPVRGLKGPLFQRGLRKGVETIGCQPATQGQPRGARLAQSQETPQGRRCLGSQWGPGRGRAWVRPEFGGRLPCSQPLIPCVASPGPQPPELLVQLRNGRGCPRAAPRLRGLPALLCGAHPRVSPCVSLCLWVSLHLSTHSHPAPAARPRQGGQTSAVQRCRASPDSRPLRRCLAPARPFPAP